jgi:chemotaxis protein methyltransferase CheR
MPAPDEITDIEVRLVLEAIHARYGFDLRGYAPESMSRRLQAIAARTGAEHLGDLQHRILLDRPFFVSIFDELTVQVSEMFRDPSFYRAFRERVVPFLRTYPQLKVWHAGCAGGEEVYATAILLEEENLYERTQSYATDLSPRALERAREGVYPDERSAGFAENYALSGGNLRFDDYCARAYGQMAIRAALRKNVVFFQHDLGSDYALGEMHVVFCRNVLIYFTAKLRQRVLDMFAESLPRGGFLCLGSSERLSGAQEHAFENFVPGQPIYRRRGQA